MLKTVNTNLNRILKALKDKPNQQLVCANLCAGICHAYAAVYVMLLEHACAVACMLFNTCMLSSVSLQSAMCVLCEYTSSSGSGHVVHTAHNTVTTSTSVHSWCVGDGDAINARVSCKEMRDDQHSNFQMSLK